MLRVQMGEPRAIEELAVMHQPLINHLARRLCWKWGQMEELVQAGNLGLLRAAQRFDVNRKVKFATYAVPWILGEIRGALRQADRNTVSLDDSYEEEQQALLDTIAGESDIDLGRLDLRLAMQNIGYEEQKLICLRYYRDKTQAETAVLLHKSQAQISRMERHALDVLRERLS